MLSRVGSRSNERYLSLDDMLAQTGEVELSISGNNREVDGGGGEGCGIPSDSIQAQDSYPCKLGSQENFQ